MVIQKDSDIVFIMYTPTRRNAINATFKADGLEGFITVCNSIADRKPPNVIASAALSRVNWELLEIPDGYSAEELSTLRNRYGFTDVEQKLSIEEGTLFRDIGDQILLLDDDQQVDPPLTPNERYAIQRLVAVVTNTIAGIAARS